MIIDVVKIFKEKNDYYIVTDFLTYFNDHLNKTSITTAAIVKSFLAKGKNFILNKN